MALKLSQREVDGVTVVALDGRIVLGGKPDELWGNEAIAAAYLGGHAKASA